MALWKTVRKIDAGQSLVEVMIALVIVTLVLITIVSAVLVALKSTQFSRHKTRGTFLAQSVIEWLRGQRQSSGWSTFTDQAGTYCMLTLDFTNPGACAAFETIDSIFVREMMLDYDNAQEVVTATVTVTWFEGDKEFSSRVEGEFYDQEYEE